MTYNAGDRKHVRAAEKLANAADRQRAEVITHLMDTLAGRQYINDKLAGAHVFDTSFSTDIITMAFKEGERNQGLKLLTEITQHCPEQFILMLREQNDRNSAAERSRESLSDGGDSGSGQHEQPFDPEPLANSEA